MNYSDLNFVNRSQAIKSTKLSYLGGINTSAKIMKNGKIGVHTYVLYLAPASTSGYNVCSHSTPECRLGCLATSGRVRMEKAIGKTRIEDARIKKTRMFHENQSFFMDWLIAEIKAKKALAEKKGFIFSIRLNGTSDIDWANILHNGLNIFEYFPDVQFYDYTKNASKFFGKPENYNLTLSYTGRNWHSCENVLKRGNNVAVVFDTTKNNELPHEFNGYPVIDGDISDYRPNDGKGVIVGLRFKEIADKEASKTVKESCFVVKDNEHGQIVQAV